MTVSVSRVCGVDYPRDKVILHSLPRDRLAPNLSHFAIKLETYLRAANIPYEVGAGYVCSTVLV